MRFSKNRNISRGLFNNKLHRTTRNHTGKFFCEHIRELTYHRYFLDLEGSDYASGSGAERRGRTRRHKPGPSPKDLQGRSASQAARAKRKAGDEASTLREEVVVTEESEDPQAERRAEDEADALRKKVIVMEESQKKLQEDLARMTNAVSAMQKMMSTGGLPNGLIGGPTAPPKF